MKLKNSNCEKLKTQIVTKLKDSKREEKTQNCDQTKTGTKKIKQSFICDKTHKMKM